MVLFASLTRFHSNGKLRGFVPAEHNQAIFLGINE